MCWGIDPNALGALQRIMWDFAFPGGCKYDNFETIQIKGRKRWISSLVERWTFCHFLNPSSNTFYHTRNAILVWESLGSCTTNLFFKILRAVPINLWETPESAHTLFHAKIWYRKRQIEKLIHRKKMQKYSSSQTEFQVVAEYWYRLDKSRKGPFTVSSVIK